MVQFEEDRKRISLRNLEPGTQVKYAYDADNNLITRDLEIQSEMDIHRLESLDVKYVVPAEEPDASSYSNSKEEETHSSEVLDRILEEEDTLRQKSQKTYEKLIGHMQNIFTKFHDGEVNLDGLYELVPYLKKFIKFVDESPASVSILIEIEDYDSITYNHSVNVSILSILYGKRRDFERGKLLELAFGALVHDIGKTQLPRDLIQKEGKLTDREYEIVKTHPEQGLKLLEDDDFNEVQKKMTYEHHERPDGTGYPEGKTKLHPFSSILSVIDVYEALVAPRTYKQSRIPLRAFKTLRDEYFPYAETRHIVHGLIHCLGIFPVGSLVRLTDNSLAVVQKNNPNDVARPVVSVVTDEAENVLSRPYLVDLHHVNQQKMLAHGHFYDENTAVKSMILPGARTNLKERIRNVYEGWDDQAEYPVIS
ncbi:MAG: HD-GYP domain-containing protein [bacterium]